MVAVVGDDGVYFFLGKSRAEVAEPVIVVAGIVNGEF